MRYWLQYVGIGISAIILAIALSSKSPSAIGGALIIYTITMYIIFKWRGNP